MRRISLIVLGAALCAALVFSGTAAAKPAPKTCKPTRKT
jgi:hypothetical protein